MPGILGIVASAPGGAKLLEHGFQAMLESMRHRSSYKQNVCVRPPVVMGRIGPGFLNPEKQPVVNEDGTLRAVFDGELFNPAPMRQRLEQAGHVLASASDAGIVLHAFEQYGVKGIADLGGAYVGFIHDSRVGACHLFTDRLGLRGCYYHCAPDGTFFFASELKAIAAVPGFKDRLDVQALAEFLNRGYPFFDRTFFEGVKFLPHGSVLTWRDGRVNVQSYWDMPRLKPDAHWRFEDAVREGAALLVQAIGRQFRQPGRIGVMLSGGMDSRAIAAGAAACGHRPPAFTLGVGDDADAAPAARVAARLGLEHHQLLMLPDYLVDYGKDGCWYTDAMVPCRELQYIPQLHYLEQRADALLSGHLAGLVLGGLFLKPVHLDEPPRTAQGEWIARQVAGEFSEFLRTGLTPPLCRDLETGFHETRRQIASGVGDRGFASETARVHLATLERRLDSICYTHVWGTVADVKFPFGDHDLLDFRGRLPLEWQMNSRLYKAILCHAFPSLVDIPCVSAKLKWVPTTLDAEPSPLRLIWRELLGQARFWVGRLTGGRVNLPPDPSKFGGHGYWYRTVPRLREWIRSILLDDRTLGRGYYNRQGIERLLRLQMTRGYLFDLLSRLVTFEFWNRFFVDREFPRGPMPL